MTLVQMDTVDQIINDSTSWSDFQTRLVSLTDKSKGDVFERLVQLHLQTSPQYTTKLSDVWLRQDVPPDIKRLLNLPDLDRGIDLIARTHGGDYWSIQAKYRNEPRSTLRMGGGMINGHLRRFITNIKNTFAFFRGTIS